LGIFNKKTGAFSFFKNDPENQKSLASDVIHGGAYFNKDRDFWVWGKGIDMENRDYFSFQQVKVPYKFWWISDFFKDNATGKLFIGTYHCAGLPVHDLKKNSWSLIAAEKPFPPEGLSINRFYHDLQGRLWVTTRSSLRYIDQQANLIRIFRTSDGKALQLTDEVVYGMTEDVDGNLWIGTRYDGVIRIDKLRKRADYFKHLPETPASLIAGTHFVGIQTDKYNRIWFGCRNGVSIYDPVKKIFFNSLIDTLHKFGIQKRWINGLEKDSLGRMWLAIDGTGLVRVDMRTENTYDIKLFHSGNGINDPGIGWISRDPYAGFWVVNNGLLHVDPYRERFQVFDHQNGLHEVPAGSARTYIDSAGNIYSGDSTGYETKNIRGAGYTEKHDLTVVFEALEINGRDSKTGFDHKIPAILDLTADQNNLTFRFTALSFHQSNHIRYRYKLKGYDKEWINAETSREARYTNLPPGKYSFFVSAAQGEGWYGCKETIHLVVHPFFWQTWWFILVCIIALFTLFAFIYRYRVNQLLKVERLRTRIATDLHDDVSSTLSGISILSDIAGRQTDNPKSSDMIREIGNNAHDMLERIDDIIWSVTPSNDKFQDLGLRIREYAIPLFESKNIQFHFEIPEKLSSLHLQMETRRNLYLIAKESINNLIKYSQCQKAEVRFREESGNLTMIVADDGIGFNPEAVTSRNGIGNMKIRAGKIGGTICITSRPGDGTQISLKVKII
jgi:two-component sensor histidine kinase/streptogramin lyase